MKKNGYRTYGIQAAALLAVCALLLTGTWAQGRQRRLAGQVLRLHVIASSDAPEDQAVKLQVRDAVLAELEPRMARAENQTQARKIAEEMLPRLQAIAAEVSGTEVSAELGREYYPTRHYDTFSLPAGVYDSLQLRLGAGEGRNWWCVVYPLLCAAAPEEIRPTAALSEDDIRLITGDGEGYVIKFRIIEWWESLTEKE